jgi:hypothetical protein
MPYFRFDFHCDRRKWLCVWFVLIRRSIILGCSVQNQEMGWKRSVLWSRTAMSVWFIWSRASDSGTTKGLFLILNKSQISWIHHTFVGSGVQSKVITNIPRRPSRYWQLFLRLYFQWSSMWGLQSRIEHPPGKRGSQKATPLITFCRGFCHYCLFFRSGGLVFGAERLK